MLAYEQQTLIKLILFYCDQVMESVDSLPQLYSSPQTHQQTFIHIQNPSLSAKLEKEALLKKIQLLMLSNKALEQKKQNLQGTVFDLRNLLALVGKEGAQESEYLHKRNGELKKKAGRLQNALKYSYKSGRHLQRCASYWTQFVQQ